MEKIRAGEVDMYGKKRNPLVLVGAVATAGVLFGGIAAFRRGNKGVTVALMVATSGVLGQDILFKDVMPKTNPFSSEAEKK